MNSYEFHPIILDDRLIYKIFLITYAANKPVDHIMFDRCKN